MIVLAGGDLVLPDRIVHKGSLVVEGDRITSITETSRRDGALVLDVADAWVVPGFVDVHVHGVEGFDALDGGDAVATIATRLPRYGVTAFCPTTVACDPTALRGVLAQIGTLRQARPPGAARVLPAHLESNFINPEYRGAQPARCLRSPVRRERSANTDFPDTDAEFSAQDILDVIAGARAEVGIVTLAPELNGGLELVRNLVAAGHRVSIGHSGASYDVAMAAIDAGVRHATHLFNRMPPMTHRSPGLVGALLERDEVVAELICDGHHVHPVMGRVVIATKTPRRIMAITDGTAGAGLPVGSTGRLGGQTIHVGEAAAVLDDGTLAGSTLTMDRAFQKLVTQFRCSVTDAAIMCATTPARALGHDEGGVIAAGAAADLVVLDRALSVLHTIVAGDVVFSRR